MAGKCVERETVLSESSQTAKDKYAQFPPPWDQDGGQDVEVKGTAGIQEGRQKAVMRGWV